MSVQLFKDGDSMAIMTDAKDERQFTDEFVALLARMIDEDSFEGDWEFQLGYWLPQFVALCCKYRGYKADVMERRMLIAGDVYPAKEPIAWIDERGNITYPPPSALDEDSA